MYACMVDGMYVYIFTYGQTILSALKRLFLGKETV